MGFSAFGEKIVSRVVFEKISFSGSLWDILSILTKIPNQSFRPVPLAVWDFHIGGYQVLDKYLKSRKGRVLSLDEITHVGAVADSLAFTIEQMATIDEAYRAAFPDWG